jgi:excisionase family DNA binding protein
VKTISCGQIPGEIAPEFFTTAQLAERWQAHPETVRRMLRERRLRSILLGRLRRIPSAAVLEFERAAAIGGGR